MTDTNIGNSDVKVGTEMLFVAGYGAKPVACYVTKVTKRQFKVVVGGKEGERAFSLDPSIDTEVVGTENEGTRSVRHIRFLEVGSRGSSWRSDNRVYNTDSRKYLEAEAEQYAEQKRLKAEEKAARIKAAQEAANQRKADFLAAVGGEETLLSSEYTTIEEMGDGHTLVTVKFNPEWWPEDRRPAWCRLHIRIKPAEYWFDKAYLQVDYTYLSSTASGGFPSCSGSRYESINEAIVDLAMHVYNQR